MNSCYRLAMLVLPLLTVACSNTGTLTVRSPLQQPPALEKSPLTVAIRYAENLRHHTCIVKKGYVTSPSIIELGAPSIEMFGQIFTALFDKAIPSGQGQHGLPASERFPYVEVGLQAYDGCEGERPIEGRTVISVAYAIALYDGDGALVGRWEGQGRAGPSDYLRAPPAKGLVLDPQSRYLAMLTELAMRRAAADFIIHYEKDQAVRAWLAR